MSEEISSTSEDPVKEGLSILAKIIAEDIWKKKVEKGRKNEPNEPKEAKKEKD